MYNAPRSHIHRPVKTPCYDCKERSVGCHSRCEKFSEYRARLDDEKNAAFNAVADDHKVAEYEIHGRRHRGFRK